MASLTFWRVWQHHRSLRQFELTVEDARVVTRYGHQPPQSVNRRDVVRLIHRPGLGFRLETADLSQSLWIPAHVPGYDAALRRLTAWAPVEERDPPAPGSSSFWDHQEIFYVWFLAMICRPVALAYPLAALMIVVWTGQLRDPLTPRSTRLVPLVLLPLLAVRLWIWP